MTIVDQTTRVISSFSGDKKRERKGSEALDFPEDYEGCICSKLCPWYAHILYILLFFFLITILRCMLLFFQSHTLYKVTNNPTPDSCLIILLTFDSLNMSISLTIKKLVTFVLEIHP